jgi:hypothetical protein
MLFFIILLLGALAKVIEACVVDAKLIDVCKLGDEFIANELKGVYTKGKIHKSKWIDV